MPELTLLLVHLDFLLFILTGTLANAFKWRRCDSQLLHAIICSMTGKLAGLAAD